MKERKKKHRGGRSVCVCVGGGEVRGRAASRDKIDITIFAH